jgi:hypothetical protein
MEYITRQHIYECRFGKEECFGLTAADGGTFGGNQQPTKFLSFTSKLLQLQPEDELIQEFISQDHFKYVRALGAFHLQLTGRDDRPIFTRRWNLFMRIFPNWNIWMNCPVEKRCNKRFFLQDRPRPTGLREVVQDAGGLEQYLKYKVDGQNSAVVIALNEKRREGKYLKQRGSKEKSKSPTMTTTSPDTDRRPQEETGETRHVDRAKEQQVEQEGD